MDSQICSSLSPNDMPEILARIFKIKLESFMDDLTKKHLLGKTVSGKFDQLFKKIFVLLLLLRFIFVLFQQ